MIKNAKLSLTWSSPDLPRPGQTFKKMQAEMRVVDDFMGNSICTDLKKTAEDRSICER